MSVWSPVTRNTVLHSARTSIAAVISTLLARSLLKLPEFYWAPVSTVVILLSSINPIKLAWQRFAGTALGAVMGALIASYLSPTWWVFGVGIFISGIISALLRIGAAYRFEAKKVCTLMIQTIDGPETVHKWAEICQH